MELIKRENSPVASGGCAAVTHNFSLSLKLLKLTSYARINLDKVMGSESNSLLPILARLRSGLAVFALYLNTIIDG